MHGRDLGLPEAGAYLATELPEPRMLRSGVDAWEDMPWL